VFYRMSGSSSYTHRSIFDAEGRLLSMRLQIGHLRSLGDTERVREACLEYLQSWLLCFYPERPDVVAQLEQLATAVGGKLEIPRLRWKYAWIERLFGYSLAKRAQFSLPELRWWLIRSLDKALLRTEGRKRSPYVSQSHYP